MMDTMLLLLEYVGPALVALLTVPATNALKTIGRFTDSPSTVKRLAVVLIAFGLTELGKVINVAVPGDLALFTGADVEALLSAGLAMAIYAGDRVKGTATAVVALFLLAPSPAAAQTDSTEVQVIDRTDLNVTITPEGLVRRFRGDSLQFTAVAVDTVSGDTLDVEFLWSSTNTNVLTIDPATGMAHFLSRGNAQVIVEVSEIVSVLITEQQDDGTWIETGDVMDVAEGDWLRTCVYVERSNGRIHAPERTDVTVTADAGATGMVELLNDGSPGVAFINHQGTFEPATLHDCPEWSTVLPLLPMPQQIELLLRQSEAQTG